MIQKLSKASVLNQNGWPNYNWNEVLHWTPDTGTVPYQDKAIQVVANQPGAIITARGEWVEAIDKASPHAVRILVNDTVIAASTQATGKAGVVNAIATTDLLAGDIVKLELFGDSAQPGTIQPPKSGGFLGIGNTPGTYLQIE